MHKIIKSIGSIVTFILYVVVVQAQVVAIPDGFATLNGGTKGGGDAIPIIVTTVDEFKAIATGNDTPAVVVVEGKLNVGDVNIGSNKTIIGVDKTSGLCGGVVQVKGKNIIFQNLVFGPTTDADVMEISGAENIFITKCEFHDSKGKLCSIVKAADFITISWCKFYFENPTSHAIAHLIGNKDDAVTDKNKLNVTLHHNWYSEGVRNRILLVRHGHVHVYNNLFLNAEGNSCLGTGRECHIRLENSHFENVNKMWTDYGGSKDGEMGWANLKLVSESQPTYMSNKFPVFIPPYSFTMDSVELVKDIVMAHAGNSFNILCSNLNTGTTYYSLITSVSGKGSISPNGSSCEKGTMLAINAIANEGWKFDSWAGDINGSNNPEKVTMSKNMIVKAIFTENETKPDAIAGSSCGFYPNASEFKLIMELRNDFSTGVLFQLYDSDGGLILNEEVVGAKHELDVRSINPGVYLIKLTNSSNRTITKRITIS